MCPAKNKIKIMEPNLEKIVDTVLFILDMVGIAVIFYIIKEIIVGITKNCKNKRKTK